MYLPGYACRRVLDCQILHTCVLILSFVDINKEDVNRLVTMPMYRYEMAKMKRIVVYDSRMNY